MKLFYCYSPRLKDFLMANKNTYLHMGQHQTTNRNFWVFEGNEKLNKCLDKWRLKSNLNK